MEKMSCCLGEIRDKEVINTCSGRRLGYVIDVEIDLCAGRLSAIIVPGEGGGIFSKPRDIRIPWEKIERIGRDTILVAMNELPPCPPEEQRKSGWFGQGG